MRLTEMTSEQLAARKGALEAEYAKYQQQNLKLDMSRGKPGPDQLDLTMGLLSCLTADSDLTASNGFDTRNYGLMDGIPEMKALFGEILGVPADQVIVGGNSSLNLMYDYIATAYAKGIGGCEPWSRQGAVKFLCPVPGYDRHFAITEFFGMEMIPVPMNDQGPNMDMVEELIADPLVKGIWCVPMYSNPTGITYSDEVVRRLAAMKPAARDFRIMWDNAYAIHHLYDTPDTLLNLYEQARQHGNQDMVILFTSTSKITFPGAGVAAVAASPANIADIKKRLTIQTIGYDKINMLRHARYFGSVENILEHMKRHAAILRPKFELVLNILEQRLGDTGIASWSRPNGGYFISVDLMEGCAKETVRLLAEAGVVMTGAGATFPYGKDPLDSNLRIAPTYPPLSELQTAMELFCICAQLAAIKVLEKRQASK